MQEDAHSPDLPNYYNFRSLKSQSKFISDSISNVVSVRSVKLDPKIWAKIPLDFASQAPEI